MSAVGNPAAASAGAAAEGSLPRIVGLRIPEGRKPRVKLYDFKRPDKFSKEQIRTMELASEEFARLAAGSLSAELRMASSLSLTMVDQMTYGEFLADKAGAAIYASFSMPPLPGQALLYLDASAGDAAIERLFGAKPESLAGGAPTTGAAAPDGITDIEYACLGRPLGVALTELGTAWAFAELGEPALSAIETEAADCRLVHPLEMIVLCAFDLALGAARGKMEIVYPFLLLEPILGKLSARYAYRPKPGAEALGGAAYDMAAKAELSLRAKATSLGELRRALRRGGRIPLPSLDEGRGELYLGGVRVAELKGLGLKAGVWEAAFEATAGGEPSTSGGSAPAAATEARDPLGGFKELDASLRTAIGSLVAEIQALKDGQLSLADQLIYGQADAARDAGPAKPFSRASAYAPEALALFLSGERAQLRALILSYLDDEAAARLLSSLPAEGRAETVRRLVELDGASRQVIETVERVLDRKLQAIGRDGPPSGGTVKAAAILGLAPRAVERGVVQELDASAPAIAEEIKRSMFVFEDLILLDDESIAAVLDAVDERDLLKAMKAMVAAERGRLFERFPEARRLALEEAYGELGRLRLRDCEEAGQRVVQAVRALEERGLIGLLPRDGRS